MFYRMKLIISVLFIANACSGEMDPDSPGLCALQCENSKIAGNETVFRVADLDVGDSADGDVNPTQGTAFSQTVSCAGVDFGEDGVEEYVGPITVAFVAEKFRRLVYRNPFENNPQETTHPGEFRQPVRGLAFEPIVVSGLMSGARTDDENADKEAGNVVNPFKYAGIVTPKSEWCTDSCGVATVELWPLCVSGLTNNINFLVHSGATYSRNIFIQMDGSLAGSTEEEETTE